MPARPDLVVRITERGHKEGRIGPMNSWPIDTLQKGDVYVADGFGKITDGTLIGDNLGNAIFAKSKTGVVFDAGARDLEGLARIPGFNAFVRGWDPSYLQQSMLMSINQPIRIGQATVFPGDVVLAKREGVIFIPPQFVEDLVINAEFIQLRDEFGIPIVLVSHALDEVIRLADTLVLVDAGRVHACGDVDDIMGNLDVSATHGQSRD
ncbi:MAG: hypothetical protein HC782_01840 [Gammaproteobacteria bacterium]|nr:hypothetical protein [Gammaproteobacteria bacterium]